MYQPFGNNYEYSIELPSPTSEGGLSNVKKYYRKAEHR